VKDCIKEIYFILHVTMKLVYVVLFVVGGGRKNEREPFFRDT
jgi:hypothetical protein